MKKVLLWCSRTRNKFYILIVNSAICMVLLILSQLAWSVLEAMGVDAKVYLNISDKLFTIGMTQYIFVFTMLGYQAMYGMVESNLLLRRITLAYAIVIFWLFISAFFSLFDLTPFRALSIICFIFALILSNLFIMLAVSALEFIPEEG